MKLRHFFIAILAILFAMPLSAETHSGTCGSNLQWMLDSETGVFTMIGSGDMDSYRYGTDVPWYDYREIITAINLPHGLTSIADYSFLSCKKVTSVTIPDKVISIGLNAFCYCEAVKDLTIGSAVESISSSAFQGCEALTTVVIPNSVTSIGYSAFNGCSGLTSLTLSASITTFSSAAFANCTALTDLVMPEEITFIGKDAFYGCTALEAITIPKSVTKIEESAFYNCSGLKSITALSTTPPSMEKNVFEGVNKAIPVYVHAVSINLYKDEWQWEDFTNYKTIEKDEDIPTYTLQVVASNPEWGTTTGGGTFKAGDKTTIMAVANADYEFLNWSDGHTEGLRNIIITSDTVLTAWFRPVIDSKVSYSGTCGEYARWKLYENGLLDITGVGSMYDYEYNSGTYRYTMPWYNDLHLIDSVHVFEGITRIGNYCFADVLDYKDIKIVRLPKTIIALGEQAVSCEGLVSIYCEAVTPPAVDGSFGWTNKSTCKLYVPSGSVAAYKSAAEWKYFTNIQAIDGSGEGGGGQTDPPIVSGQCGDNMNFTLDTISGQLDITGTGAIYNYPWWSQGPLWGCPPPWWYAEEGCYVAYPYYIATLNLPVGLTAIGSYAFAGCTQLVSITCPATTPPTLGSDVFKNVTTSIPVYVPAGSINAYKAAEQWKDFTNIQAIGGGGGDTPGGDPVVNTLLPEAIDLGLPSGIRWSGMNVGAKTETEYGNFYQWGCTTPVTREGWDSYCHGAKNALTKYCTNNAFGTVDNKTVLDNADDAAAQTWGEGWRMPTKEEAEELWNNCTRTWHITPDCEGYIFTGPNGNSIFLPSQGWYDESGVAHSVDMDGFYWTSTLYDNNNNGAYALLTRQTTGNDGVLSGNENRHFARGIRGVLPKRSCRVTNTANVTITEGESFTYAGKTVTPAAGQYTYSAILAGANGCDSVLIWNVTVNKASVTMYTLSVKSNDARLGFVSGGGSYKSRETISVLAVPTAKCRFVKWNDGVTSNPRTVIMTKDYTFTAIFAAVAGSAEEKIGEQQEYDEKKDAVDPWANTSKVIQNGHIYILRNGKMYTVQGQEVK